jgi:hypothetical protein
MANEKEKCGEFRVVVMASINPLLLLVECSDQTTKLCKT